MPPKAKFLKEEIIKAALSLVRKGGVQTLTARALAEELGSSARPIFTIFQSMEEVQQEVLKSANEIFQSYKNDFMTCGKYHPIEADGLAYICFAKEETEFFKLLFMRNRTKDETENKITEQNEFISIIIKDTGLSFDNALKFDLETWIYAHGIATMLATNYSDWDLETIRAMFNDAYEGLKYRFLLLEDK